MASSKKIKQGSRIPPDFFIYPELLAIVFIPMTWVLMPVIAFHPGLFEPHVHSAIFSLILAIQWPAGLFLKTVLVVHGFELVYAAYRCYALQLDTSATIKWLINVSLNGVFALKMLHEPEKFYKKIA